MSRLQSKDRSMPLFDKLLSKLSGDVGGSTYSYKGTEIEAIALSTEIWLYMKTNMSMKLES